jgi:uncharacterized alkaline shock family protein YloU
MPESENPVKNDDDIGEVKISSDVIMVIAHTVASEVEGVASMNAKIADNISSVLGRKSTTKGVKVEVDEKKDVTIDFYIVIDYGSRIPDVAWKIQDRVKSAVESMTGMNVASINVHVEGVSFEKGKEEQKSE